MGGYFALVRQLAFYPLSTLLSYSLQQTFLQRLGTRS
nr:MAG TPA: hypothetical protein [Caudoviricetes sp.]